MLRNRPLSAVRFSRPEWALIGITALWGGTFLAVHVAMQHSGLWISQGLMPANTKASARDAINYVGSYGGLMTQSPSDASPAEMSKGDLETARVFGERIAAVTTSRAA